MRVTRCLFKWSSPRALRRKMDGLLSKVQYWKCFQLCERQVCIPLKCSTWPVHQNHSYQLHTPCPQAHRLSFPAKCLRERASSVSCLNQDHPGRCLIMSSISRMNILFQTT